MTRDEFASGPASTRRSDDSASGRDEFASGPVADASDPAMPVPGAPPPERYTRLGLIGAGGMGRVYLARDHWLGRHVALKEALDDRLAHRLAREVRVTAGLEHPGIVTVYDEGRGADGRMFYTMRLMRGRPLAQRIRESVDLRARLALLAHYLDACQAVAYAHAQAVVHRDLKPANIMLGAFGETQVVDWGLALRLADPPDDPPGAVVGTPAYMSPEQARGQPADPRFDVWALGVILRELLAGSPQQPLPRDVPAELAAVVARATATLPAARYPDAGALAADVAAWLDGRRVDAHRYTALEIGLRFARAWRVPLLVAGVAIAVIAALTVVHTLRLRTQRDRAVIAEQDVRRALAESDRNLAAALVAQARTADHQSARAVSEVLAAHALRLADTPEARGLLAGARAAARPIRLASAELPPCHPLTALAVDDIVCAADDELVRIVAGVEQWRVPTGRQTKELRVDAGRVWAVAFGYASTVVDLATGAPDGDTWDIVDFNVGDAWPVRSVGLPGVTQQFLVESCGDDALIGNTGQIDGPNVLLCADGRVGRATSPGPAELARAFGPGDFVTFTHLTMTPDARRIVVAGTHGRVGVHDLATRAAWTVAPPRPDSVRQLAVGPDGDRVAVARERGGVDLYTLPELHPIGTIAASGVRDLRLRPDGSLLIADADAVTLWALPVLPRPDRFAEDHGVTSVAFAPDDGTLLTTHGEGRVVVWDRATGVRRHTITSGRGTIKAGAFLPDGQRFAVVRSGPGARGPQIFSAATGELLIADFPLALSSISRRVIALADDLVVTAPYGPGLDVIPLRGSLHASDCPHVEWLDLAADPRGEQFALVSVDGAVFVAGLDLRCRPVAAPAGAFAADVGEDGRSVVVGAARSLARIDDGVARWLVDHPGVRTNDVAVSPDLRWVASAGPDDAARVWDADTGALRAVLTGHDARVAAVEFSRDSRFVATGSWDGTTRLWDLATLDETVAALVADAGTTWGLDLAGALARR